jgi:hypothetical protein
VSDTWTQVPAQMGVSKLVPQYSLHWGRDALLSSRSLRKIIFNENSFSVNLKAKFDIQKLETVPHTHGVYIDIHVQ